MRGSAVDETYKYYLAFYLIFSSLTFMKVFFFDMSWCTIVVLDYKFCLF